MIFNSPKPLLMLYLRRPRPVWITLGLIAAIVAAAAAATAIVFFAEIPIRLGLTSPVGGRTYSANAPIAAGQVFAIAGAAAALCVGAPWYALTHARARKRRFGVIIEGFWIAVAATVLVGVIVAIMTTANLVAQDNAAANGDWFGMIATSVGVVLVISVFGSLFAAPAGIAAGIVLSLVAFTHAAPADNEPDHPLARGRY